MVNAKTEPCSRPDQVERTLRSGQVLKSVTHIPIHRYNFETVELAKEYFKHWAEEIRVQRCRAFNTSDGVKPAFSEPDSCEDIRFYLVEIDFDALPDKSGRSYFKSLPTSLYLQPKAVDRLRAIARRILSQSPEFQ